jgi:hypothetical protein
MQAGRQRANIIMNKHQPVFYDQKKPNRSVETQCLASQKRSTTVKKISFVVGDPASAGRNHRRVYWLHRQSTGDSGTRASRLHVLTVFNVTNASGTPAFQYYCEQTSTGFLCSNNPYQVRRLQYEQKNFFWGYVD